MNKKIKTFWIVVLSLFSILVVVSIYFFGNQMQTRNEASLISIFSKPCNPKITRCGSIKIIKDTIPDSSHQFFFIHNVPGYPFSFILDDDGSLPNPSTTPNSILFNTPWNGTFYISETLNQNFSVDIACSDPTGDTTVNQNTAIVNITNGENVTCIFYNKSRVTTPANSKNSCQISDSWVQKQDIPTFARAGDMGFSNSSMGYISGGYGSEIELSFPYQLNDLWQYNPQTDTWTQKADFPGGLRHGSISFTIGDKSYKGLGVLNSGPVFFNDLWQYNPQTDTWTQKASLPASGRTNASVFVVGDRAYVGFGENGINLFDDLWQYNPQTDTWTQKASFNTPVSSAHSFSLGDKGYVVNGFTGGGIISPSLWQYNPQTDTWTQKADFPGVVRMGASTFTIDQNAYIVNGFGLSSLEVVFFNDLWQYNPQTDTWTQKASLPSLARSHSSSFTLNDAGFIVAGGRSVNGQPEWFKNVWQYCP